MAPCLRSPLGSPGSSLAAAAAAVAWTLAAAGTPADARPATAREFRSAERCGTCHRDIHAAWKQSAHAHSLEAPLFQDALEELRAEGGDERVCLGCHAPIAGIARDVTLDRKITWEGVTCDYCHSTESIEAGPIPRLRVVPGNVKYGPIEDAASGDHETAFRDFFTKSEVCAPCHEYTSPSGVGVLTTYSDWKASPQAAAGKTCQSCHMSAVRGDVVDPKVQRVPEAEVNLHSMPGGHSIDQLNQAVRARGQVARRGDKLELEVEVVNRGAGHAVPTGSAARQVVLDVRMDTNRGQRVEETRVYQRVLTDADGVPLVRDRDLFARAVKLASDTRLQAGETRTERFQFAIDPGSLVNLKLQLSYRYTPAPGREPLVSQVFYTQSWTLPPAE